MLFFKRNKEKDFSLDWLHTDMHSHLVPGIDDGSPDISTSITLIQGLSQLGYKKIITTPHVLGEVYPNTTETITRGMNDVKEAIVRSDMNIEFSAAAEYFIDEYFVELIKTKTPLLCISNNLVLVEFSMLTPPMDLLDVLFEMQMQGYQPVIAHPERYVYLKRNKEFFDELKNAGCLLQLNLLSMIGYYGSTVQELTEYLIKMEYYSYAGTDMHNRKHLDLLPKLASSPSFRKLKDSGAIKNYLL